MIREAKQKGWRVEKGGYWKIYCPCPKKHFKTIKNTPSNPNYKKNLIFELKRSTCW